MTLQRLISDQDIDLYETALQETAKQSLLGFRQYMHPHMKFNWWVIEITQRLQRFYHRLKAGERPKMLVCAPPQHGKTSLVEDFLAWVAGVEPAWKTMFTSYSDDLGLRVNVSQQRMLQTPQYLATFGERLAPRGNAAIGFRNLGLLEFPKHGGQFRNTTVLGQITGQGLDLGVIDDPIKGRKEANSPTIRNSTWNWLTDDFFTRFSDQAGMLLTLTRWHLDDPAARFLAEFPETEIVSYPAIAEQNERYRSEGDALFPEFKSLEFLAERRKLLTVSSWLALYQQRPIALGGDMFHTPMWEIVEAVPRGTIGRGVRYWDKAGTEDGGAYSCGTRMHKLRDGTFIVTDVRRGQWGTLKREQMIAQTAELDGSEIDIIVEQEPGSGGKESAESTIRNLAGYRVQADKVTGSKVVRAEPYAAQQQAGNIKLLKALWTRGYMEEHEVFPNGTFMDQVDSGAGAFTYLTLKAALYDGSLEWVGEPTYYPEPVNGNGNGNGLWPHNT